MQNPRDILNAFDRGRGAGRQPALPNADAKQASEVEATRRYTQTVVQKNGFNIKEIYERASRRENSDQQLKSEIESINAQLDFDNTKLWYKEILTFDIGGDTTAYEVWIACIRKGRDPLNDVAKARQGKYTPLTFITRFREVMADAEHTPISDWRGLANQPAIFSDAIKNTPGQIINMSEAISQGWLQVVGEFLSDAHTAQIGNIAGFNQLTLAQQRKVVAEHPTMSLFGGDFILPNEVPTADGGSRISLRDIAKRDMAIEAIRYGLAPDLSIKELVYFLLKIHGEHIVRDTKRLLEALNQPFMVDDRYMKEQLLHRNAFFQMKFVRAADGQTYAEFPKLSPFIAEDVLKFIQTNPGVTVINLLDQINKDAHELGRKIITRFTTGGIVSLPLYVQYNPITRGYHRRTSMPSPHYKDWRADTPAQQLAEIQLRMGLDFLIQHLPRSFTFRMNVTVENGGRETTEQRLIPKDQLSNCTLEQLATLLTFRGPGYRTLSWNEVLGLVHDKRAFAAFFNVKSSYEQSLKGMAENLSLLSPDYFNLYMFTKDPQKVFEFERATQQGLEVVNSILSKIPGLGAFAEYKRERFTIYVTTKEDSTKGELEALEQKVRSILRLDIPECANVLREKPIRPFNKAIAKCKNPNTGAVHIQKIPTLPFEFSCGPDAYLKASGLNIYSMNDVKIAAESTNTLPLFCERPYTEAENKLISDFSEYLRSNNIDEARELLDAYPILYTAMLHAPEKASRHETLLHWLAFHAKPGTEMFSLLYDILSNPSVKAHINQYNGIGWTPLFEAINAGGEPKVIRLFLDFGADPNQVASLSTCTETSRGRSPRAFIRPLELVYSKLEYSTSLVGSVEWIKWQQVIEVLKNAGAHDWRDYNRNRYHHDPMIPKGALSRDAILLQILSNALVYRYERDADSGRMYPKLCAVNRAHLKRVLDREPKLAATVFNSRVRYRNQTLLQLVCKTGDLEAVNYLLSVLKRYFQSDRDVIKHLGHIDNGTSARKGSFRSSALTDAIMGNNPDVVKALIDAHMPLNKEGFRRACWTAAKVPHIHPGIISLLLALPRRLRLADELWQHALQNRNHQLVLCLHDHGIQAKDNIAAEVIQWMSRAPEPIRRHHAVIQRGLREPAQVANRGAAAAAEAEVAMDTAPVIAVRRLA